MLIPIKCFTCGKVLADKWEYYQREVRNRKVMLDVNASVVYLQEDNVEKTAEGIVMDELGLTKICCRRHLLTHVDIE